MESWNSRILLFSSSSSAAVTPHWPWTIRSSQFNCWMPPDVIPTAPQAEHDTVRPTPTLCTTGKVALCPSMVPHSDSSLSVELLTPGGTPLAVSLESHPSTLILKGHFQSHMHGSPHLSSQHGEVESGRPGIESHSWLHSRPGWATGDLVSKQTDK